LERNGTTLREQGAVQKKHMFNSRLDEIYQHFPKGPIPKGPYARLVGCSPVTDLERLVDMIQKNPNRSSSPNCNMNPFAEIAPVI
jgi:hypothetical protein